MENHAKRKSETENVKELVHPDGGYGWIIVVAIILINSTLLTLVQCFGIIFNNEFKSMENQRFKASFLLHLQSSLFCIVGFFSSPLLKMYDFRTVAVVGASLMCTGIFLTSFVESYGMLIFTVSVMTGVGQGILMPATYLATYTYFKKRLTVAVSISTTGASLTSIVMPIICNHLLTSVGRKNTILLLFANSLLGLLSCGLLKPLEVKKNYDKSIEMESNENRTVEQNNKEEVDVLLNSKVYNDTTVTVKSATNWLHKFANLFDLQLLKEVPYVLAVIGLGLSFAAELNTVVLLPFILPDLSNFQQGDIANVTSLQFAFDLAGRLVIPLLTHWFEVPSKVVYASALVAATFSRTILTIWFESHLLVFGCCALIGLAKGTRAVFQSVIIPKLVSLEKIPGANGINMLFNGTVSLIIGPIIGVVRDRTNSDIPALHTASTISMTCVTLWILQWICLRNKQNDVQ